MEIMDQSCYAKFIDVVNGNDVYLRTLPCVIGRYSQFDKPHVKDKKNCIGKTIELDHNDYKDFNISEYKVRSKLILEKCKRL
jgi:hypothetical protein